MKISLQKNYELNCRTGTVVHAETTSSTFVNGGNIHTTHGYSGGQSYVSSVHQTPLSVGTVHITKCILKWDDSKEEHILSFPNSFTVRVGHSLNLVSLSSHGKTDNWVAYCYNRNTREEYLWGDPFERVTGTKPLQIWLVFFMSFAFLGCVPLMIIGAGAFSLFFSDWERTRAEAVLFTVVAGIGCIYFLVRGVQFKVEAKRLMRAARELGVPGDPSWLELRVTTG